MRRALLLTAMTAVVVTVVAGTAGAKGLMGTAMVEGKGLSKGITFTGDRHGDEGFSEFMGHTGLMGAIEGMAPGDWTKSPPTDDLGPRYTITWDLEQFEGTPVHVVQDLYPYAHGGPLVYTPKTARILQSDIPIGWYEAAPALRSHLESRGLPEANPDAATSAAAADAARDASGALPYALLAVVAGLIAAGAVVLRFRPRPARSA